MTDDANRLTLRATGATVPSGHLRAFVDAVERLGYDRTALLSAAGVTAAALVDPDAVVPSAAIGDVVCFAQRRPIPNLGLRVAMEVPIGAFALLDYLILTSQNVGEGIHALARYLSITGAPIVLTIHEDEDPIRVAINGDPFSIEYSVALLVKHMRGETGGKFTIEFLSFMHAPNDPAEFEKRLGCPVHVHAPWSGVAISRAIWSVQLRRRDPALRGLLTQQAEAIRKSAAQNNDLVARVRAAIVARLGSDTSIQRIAADLNITTRTLQRRLEEGDESFEAVRDDVFRESAERCLGSDKISIAEIAYLLGYSEPAAFHRAFKRWTGVTPQAFRDQLRSSSTSPL